MLLKTEHFILPLIFPDCWISGTMYHLICSGQQTGWKNVIGRVPSVFLDKPKERQAKLLLL